MTAALREAGPWLLLIAILWGCYRWSLRQDTREQTAEERYRQRMADRYHELEFDVEPLEPHVYDRDQDDAIGTS